MSADSPPHLLSWIHDEAARQMLRGHVVPAPSRISDHHQWMLEARRRAELATESSMTSATTSTPVTTLIIEDLRAKSSDLMSSNWCALLESKELSQPTDRTQHHLPSVARTLELLLRFSLVDHSRDKTILLCVCALRDTITQLQGDGLLAAMDPTCPLHRLAVLYEYWSLRRMLQSWSTLGEDLKANVLHASVEIVGLFDGPLQRNLRHCLTAFSAVPIADTTTADRQKLAAAVDRAALDLPWQFHDLISVARRAFPEIPDPTSFPVERKIVAPNAPIKNDVYDANGSSSDLSVSESDSDAVEDPDTGEIQETRRTMAAPVKRHREASVSSEDSDVPISKLLAEYPASRSAQSGEHQRATRRLSKPLRGHDLVLPATSKSVAAPVATARVDTHVLPSLRSALNSRRDAALPLSVPPPLSKSGVTGAIVKSKPTARTPPELSSTAATSTAAVASTASGFPCRSKYHPRYSSADKHGSASCPFCTVCHMMEMLFNGCASDCTWKHKPTQRKISLYLKRFPDIFQMAMVRMDDAASGKVVPPKVIPL